jgi:hypothetical protein
MAKGLVHESDHRYTQVDRLSSNIPAIDGRSLKTEWPPGNYRPLAHGRALVDRRKEVGWATIPEIGHMPGDGGPHGGNAESCEDRRGAWR